MYWKKWAHILHSRDDLPCMVEPQDDNEREFIDRFAHGEYKPFLIFGEGDVSSRAADSPGAAWKLQNLKKMEK